MFGREDPQTRAGIEWCAREHMVAMRLLGSFFTASRVPALSTLRKSRMYFLGRDDDRKPALSPIRLIPKPENLRIPLSCDGLVDVSNVEFYDG